MEWKPYLMIFGTVFMAELGDKTQLATLLFAADRSVSRLGVFLAASGALVVATLLGVAAGSFVGDWLNEQVLRYVAAAGFMGIGLWILLVG